MDISDLDYGGSGLELVHVSDVLDYLGKPGYFNTEHLVSFELLKLWKEQQCPIWHFLFSGISDPDARKQTRNHILYPTTTTTEAFKHTNSDNSDTFNKDLVYIMFGAGVTSLAFVLIIFIFVVLYHLKR